MAIYNRSVFYNSPGSCMPLLHSFFAYKKWNLYLRVNNSVTINYTMVETCTNRFTNGYWKITVNIPVRNFWLGFLCLFLVGMFPPLVTPCTSFSVFVLNSYCYEAMEWKENLGKQEKMHAKCEKNTSRHKVTGI